MKSYVFVDLHIHTAYSHEDGCDISVEQLLDSLQAKAEKEEGEVCFSITDHESILGCIEANELLTKYPEKYNRLTFIPGIECNTSLKSLGLNSEGRSTMAKCHMLGYGYNLNDKNLIAYSKLMHYYTRTADGRRVNTGRQVVFSKRELEKKLGLTFPFEYFESCLNYTTHKEIREEFINIISKHSGLDKQNVENLIKDTFNPIEKFSEIAETNSKQDILVLIEMIKNAGGKISIAHPKSIRYREVSDYKNQTRTKCIQHFFDVLQKKSNYAVDGIEIFHKSNMKEEFMPLLFDIAKKYNLYITCGSDYHGGTLHASHKLSKCFNDSFELASINHRELFGQNDGICNTISQLPFIEFITKQPFTFKSRQDYVVLNCEHGNIYHEEVCKILGLARAVNIEKYKKPFKNVNKTKQERKQKKKKKKHNKKHYNQTQSQDSKPSKYVPLEPVGMDVEEYAMQKKAKGAQNYKYKVKKKVKPAYAKSKDDKTPYKKPKYKHNNTNEYNP